MRVVNWIVVVTLGSLGALSCSSEEKIVPAREEVVSLLQQEAQSLKREGEVVSPVLAEKGVKITWTIKSVDVQPQPENDTEPFRGKITFQVDSESPEPDGTKARESFEKVFDYGWDPGTGKWLLR